MLFSVFYVGDSCQGWGREFESRFPLQNFKKPLSKDEGFLFVYTKIMQTKVKKRTD